MKYVLCTIITCLTALVLHKDISLVMVLEFVEYTALGGLIICGLCFILAVIIALRLREKERERERE